MITVRIRGGLGNQLFRYAAGLKLSQLYDTTLCLDISFYNQGKRDYLLDAFKLQEHELITEPFREEEITFYKYYQYSKDFLVLGDDSVICGFFQSEKFFEGIEKKIEEVFVIKEKTLEGIHTDIVEKIKQSNSVSVHVRRTDYLNYETFNVCGLEYYKNAFDYINNKVDSPHFYVFSDDIDWCKTNFTGYENISFVVAEDDLNTTIADFYLMSLCKHNIIANSTFSWWAAWLNRNNHKIVVAPDCWFKAPSTLDPNQSDVELPLNRPNVRTGEWLKRNLLNFSDVVPNSWVKIPVGHFC